MPNCSKCNDTGVIETGNNDLPCSCPAGGKALFNTADSGTVTGQQWRDMHLPPKPAPVLGRPITPDEINKLTVIPAAVFEIFNVLITEKWDGREAVIPQGLVVERIETALGCSSRTIYDKHYLDVESAYRQVGWEVDYWKPGFNEHGSATFTFRKKPKNEGFSPAPM